jgi:hypothetical protein
VFHPGLEIHDNRFPGFQDEVSEEATQKGVRGASAPRAAGADTSHHQNLNPVLFHPVFLNQILHEGVKLDDPLAHAFS